MKRIAVVVVIVLALIQLIPVDRDNPIADPSDEIMFQGNVKNIIRAACYDCHSNNTTWPWYSYVAPVSWFIASDVHEGRRKMNFSEWNKYSEKRSQRKMHDIGEEVEEGEMPLPMYVLMHSKADLNENQRKILINWAKANSNTDAADSLSDD